MNKTAKSQKPNQPFMSTTQNPLPSPKKQFPSITLSKHLQDYKAYRSIDNKKKFPDIDKNNTYTISPQEKSLLMNRNLDMPSIHNANQMSSIEGFLNMGDNKIQKLQLKIWKSLLTTKKQEEWKLYMTKSELTTQKSQQCEEIQEFLLKFISKSIDKNMITNGVNVSISQQGHSQRQQSQLISQQQKKMNKTSNSFLQTSMNGLNKKGVQPSLKLLKDQLNTFGSNNSKDASIIDMNVKTSVNFRPDGKGLLIQRIEARHEEEVNKLTFERSILQKKLELYQGRISQLQNRLRQQNICIQPAYDQASPFSEPQQSKPRKTSTADQLMMSNLINQNKYKSEAEFKKIQNQTLLRQLGMIKEYSFKLKIDNEKLLEQIGELEKQCHQCRQYKKYKELWLMQAQEMIGWKTMWRERKDDTQKLLNKIKILKQKNKQLLHSFNFSMVVNPDQQEDKQQLENIIKGFQQWLRVISVPRVNCTLVDPKSLLEETGLKEQQYMPDPQNVNYKLLKPNFFIFFEAYQKTIMMEKNILNTRPLEPTFFVKIRAILDSMYNHFNSYGNYKYWTSFPQFVIGFLEKYQISFTTLKMEPRKKPMASEEKLTFLMNLFNKKLSNTWECDMFRSFILEEYTLDEIYFFLDCRNDLNGGSTLTHGFGTMDPVCYVKLHKALATAQKKLFPYENYIIERVKTILKSRKKEKGGQLFVDRHFVLKLLLEVYALEKLKSQRIFEASFKTKNNKKTPVSYSDYFSFMSKNFDFLTTIDICELYRETYAMSSGKITYKAVHYVCQSRGLFIPLIWSKRLNMNVLQKSLNNDMMLLDLQNSARKMNGHLGELGVQEVSRLQNDLNYFLRQLDWYRNNRQVFYFKLQEIKTKIMKATCLLDWQSSTYTPNELLSTDEIRQGILQIHSLIHQSDNSTKLLSKKRQDKQKAVKQITHNFKIRIQQSMRQFRRVDDDQLRKLKEQMAVQIKNRNKKDITEQDMEKQIYQQESIKKIVIGNSFANVNDMLLNNAIQTKSRNARISAIKDGNKDNTSNSNQGNPPSKQRHLSSRKQNKLLTIFQANQNQ